MKFANTFLILLISVLVAGCGGGSGGGNTGGSGGGASNVLAITVNGSLCSANSYPNKPCVSVTICSPGTSTCQTISDILLDTGSYGLRIFKQALNVALPQAPAGSGSLAECLQFLDGSSLWGPVQTASVILGNEPAVQMRLQVIDATFGAARTVCQGAEPSQATAGFNGVLGVGLLVQDCGPACASSAGNGMYYSCSGSNCSGTAVPLADQVQNPVALLPNDNNGVIVQLPPIPSGGSSAVNGNLVLGIGTQANNTPAAVTMFAANQVGEFTTSFNGTSTSSFIDSGSNGLFFTPPSASLLPDCPGNLGWFCPPTTITSLSATNVAASGAPSGVVSFQIGNFTTLFNSSNNVFNDIGGPASPGSQFDWGLPFFFGRDVFIGLEGKGSSLGTGPYWAY